MKFQRVIMILLAALLLPGLALAQTTTRATFTVQKVFHDGNDITPVTVSIQCFTGLPLNQSATRTPDEGDFEVEFVVESFEDGLLDCDISESDVEGYSGSYEITADNAESTNDTDDACEFENVSSGGEGPQNVCVITNFADYVDVEITKEWVIDGKGGDSLNTNYTLTLVCDGPDLPPEHPGVINGGTYDDDKYSDTYGQWVKSFEGNTPRTFTAEVVPDWDGDTDCYVDETVYDSAVEVENGCGNLEVEIGVGDSCTIINTVFFEGIPTLSQYGMAIMALLMLGVGFVGFRRFV